VYLKKEFKIFILLIFFGLLFFLFYYSLNKNKNFEPKVMIGKQFPNLTEESLFNNETLNIKQISNNNLFLVNIFASWCVPCKIEHPFLMKLKNKNILIIGINYKDTKINAKKFLRKLKNPYQEVLLDYKGELSINLGAYGVPETYLVDKNFTIIDKQIGPINNDFVEKVLNLK
jgi:cytochrome c biogenesis protein CcmG/thiol:disulfide interchange protein DsbE